MRYRGYWYDGWNAGESVTGGSYGGGQNSFQGHAEDAPLPWYWLRARYYDPYLERFLEPDPSAQDGVRSYAYCHDDPLDCSDPSGLAGVGPTEEQQPVVEVGGVRYTPGEVLPVAESDGAAAGL